MKTIGLILIFLVGFLTVHFLKLLRFYLVLLEQKIPLREFLLLYLKTTFVNLLIPYKLGEFYRAFCVTRRTDCVEIGILSVVLDRFFDTFSLLVFLLPYDLLTYGRPSLITGVLLIFLVLVMLFYYMFLPTYRYLNAYLIRSSRTRRGIHVLTVLEALRGWYDYIRNLIKGRQYLILCCSAFGWLSEAALLHLLCVLCGREFGVRGFAAYIQSIFGVGERGLLRSYSLASMAALLICLLIVWVAAALRKARSRAADAGEKGCGQMTPAIREKSE